MQYSRIDDKVTVEFSVNEFAELLAILGAALLLTKDKSDITAAVGRFIQELNRTNKDIALYAGHEFTELV